MKRSKNEEWFIPNVWVMNFWTAIIISLFKGSGNKLSRFMPLSKKKCFDIDKGLKFGKI